MADWLKKQITRVRLESKDFPYAQVFLRMTFDFIMVNLSMIGAYKLRVYLEPNARAQVLSQQLWQYIRNYWVFWSALAILVFHLSGFYTRSRGYADRFKAVIVFRTISLYLVVFVFLDYLIIRGQLAPRGTTFLAWLFLCITVGVPRLVIDVVRNTPAKPMHDSESLGRAKGIETVLVVGGGGYIGSSLVPQLLGRNYKVRVLETFLFGEAPLRAVREHPNLEVIKGDVRDIQSVVRAVKDCNAVIHLAAIVGDPACDADHSLAMEINRAATRMLLDVARGYGVSRFIFASTCSVYGASDFLVDEHTQPSPISLYARTKVDSEELVLKAASPNFHPTVLRLATLFGLSPRPRFDLVVNLLTARAAKLGKITIFNGSQWRPLMHVRDAARAFIVVLEGQPGVVSGQIFNVGDYNLNYRLSDISEKIAAVAPNVEIERIENSDRRNYRVSFDKIHCRLGFRCEFSLEFGIEEIYRTIASDEISDFTADIFSNLAVVRAFASSAEARESSLRFLYTLAGYDNGATDSAAA